jgi:hypothetical protein
MSSKKAFIALNNSADPNLVSAWEQQEAATMASRNAHPKLMDVYTIKVKKGLRESASSCRIG